MKIRVAFTLDVDEHGWAEEFGVNPSEVREDVRAYFEVSAKEQLRVIQLEAATAA